MKTIRFMVISAAFMALTATGCGGPCKDLEGKKGECAKAGPMKATCEAGVDAAVKAANADACKAMLTGLDTIVKAGAAAGGAGAPAAAPEAPK